MANQLTKVGSSLTKQLLQQNKLFAHNSHARHSTVSIKQLNVRVTKETDTPPIRGPIAYQQDVGLHNLHEISDLYRSDPSCANIQYNNHNILSAMNAFCQTDRPWWTARDDTGSVIGCVLATEVNDMFSRLSNLYVIPEVKGHQSDDIARTLYKKAADSVHDQNHSLHTTTPIGSLPVSINYSPDLKIDEMKNMSFRYGTPSLNRDLLKHILPETSDTFQIMPFNRNQDLEEIKQFDQEWVHSKPRASFWDIYMDPSVVTAYVAIDNVFKTMCGFGAIQKSFDEDCLIVGPLYAETDHIAQVLLSNLMENYIPGKQLMVSHYERNNLMNVIFQMMNLPVVVPVVNCYTKEILPDQTKTKHLYLSSSSGITVQ